MVWLCVETRDVVKPEPLPWAEALVQKRQDDLQKDLFPTWMGHSIAHWEGDTLVADTIGMYDRSWIDLNRGYPVTERTHIVERFRRPDLGHLELEITIDDPTVFTKPWCMKKITQLAPVDAGRFSEYVCNESERDAAHLVGRE